MKKLCFAASLFLMLAACQSKAPEDTPESTTKSAESTEHMLQYLMDDN